MPQRGSPRSNLHGVNWHEYDAALFDLDGVLTPTAEVHMRAWQQLFADFLARRGLDQPYVESDYFDYIDGKPRYDCIRAFLASRDIKLAEGTPGQVQRNPEVIAAYLGQAEPATEEVTAS